MVAGVHQLRVKIFADGAEKDGMLALGKVPYIKGFTTNPTLMKKAGVTDYVGFAKEILQYITDKPVSFEVFSDDFTEMERQARIINSWAPNVYVKIPITNTKRESSMALVKKLSHEGVQLNVTALLTIPQVQITVDALSNETPAIISVFAGRIADTGHNPVPMMKEAKKLMAHKPNIELLWASTRQLYNIYEAEETGTDIITIPHDILKKLDKIDYDHHELSLETVKMFYDDGQKVGYTLY
jgi:transaldolase